MSIVIFGDLFSFPEGNAATNRVYTYAKGFKEHGIKVHIICFANEFRSVQNGLVEGIPYSYPFSQEKRNKYFIIRRWQKLCKYFRAINAIRKINSEEKILAINLWTNLHITYLFGWILAKLCKTKLITECSEHPLSHFQVGRFTKLIGALKYYIESHLCDGVLCISKYLVEYYKSRGIDSKRLFLVPSTVDPSRFLIKNENPLQCRYIGYFGSLTFRRDNVDSLIKAYAKIIDTHPGIYLVLGGFCSDIVRKEIDELLQSLNLKHRVKIINYLSRQDIVDYIMNAEILVMVRSVDLESIASYPSKLTEFLATGKPVVTVDVGEVSDYLTDGVNAFLVEPANCIQLAEKLDFVLRNYQSAELVGKRGKELAYTIFNYEFQAKRILAFLNSFTALKN
jgi:glycosyltransferase involved in cell wall biosynthesis